MPAVYLGLIDFPFWWYYTVPTFLLKLLKKLTIYYDHKLAVSLMIRAFFVPLFGDRSFLGLIIGIIFRSLRVVAGMVFIVTEAATLITGLFLWLAFPYFLCFRFRGVPFALAFLLFLALARYLLIVFQGFARRRRQAARLAEISLRLESQDKEASVSDKEAVTGWVEKKWAWEHPAKIWEDHYVLGPIGGVNRAWTGRVTPTLDAYSLDLTSEAARGRLSPLFGKKGSLDDLMRVLEKESANNVLLVGPTGCGKTSLVGGLAGAINKGTECPALAGRRLVSLEIGVLMAGAKSGGELQERLVGVLHDIEASGNIILFIDEVHNAISVGGGVETALIFSSLEPRLAAGKFQMIGATSWENYRKYIEPNEAFARLFQTVEIPEASFEETLEILEYLSLGLERKYGLKISYYALKKAIDLASRFVYERVLPDKAVGILEESVVAASRKKIRNGWVTGADVEELVTQKTHIPVMEITADESHKLLNLEPKMHERLIGQEDAIKAIADSIRRARVGLRDPHRPIASLLFVGPTGVGKTEAAKTLAETFFGSETNMVSFDMSEYQQADSVNRLLGVVGGDAGASLGLLTEKIRKNPFSLVLFDEVEKSAPPILDLFLQVLEEGHLTDAAGHTVDFSNTIIIFTSNAGTEAIYTGLRSGKAIEEISRDVFTFLQGSFRVELLNRFDGVIVFKPLTVEQISRIVRLKLKGVQRLIGERGITLQFREELVAGLARLGFDPALGARPLRRLIQDKIEAELARKVLLGELKKGDNAVLGPELLDGL